MEGVFLPSVILAHRLGQRVGLGATLAMHREDLFRSGGFAAIADVLMDDYQLAAQIEKRGLRTHLSEYVVGSTLGKTTFVQGWSREVRWARGIRVTEPAKYWGLLFTYPTPWAIALALATGLQPGSLLLLVMTLMLRWIIAWDVMRVGEGAGAGSIAFPSYTLSRTPEGPGEGNYGRKESFDTPNDPHPTLSRDTGRGNYPSRSSTARAGSRASFGIKQPPLAD